MVTISAQPDLPAGLKPQAELVSAEQAQLLLPKLSNEQLETLGSFGTLEPTSVGQVLAAAGDPTYDLMVVLEGEVEVSDIHEGVRRLVATLRKRDFLGELNLLTGQRVYVTYVVSQGGSIIRVPRRTLKTLMDADGALGDLLIQTMFRRREALLFLRSGMTLIGSRFSPDTQRLREFAARNRLAFSWLDLDNDPVAPTLLRKLRIEIRDTPVVLLGGAEALVNPSNSEFANAAGIADEPATGSVFDLLIVGAGPAGVEAAVYGATEGLSTAVVDLVAPGGQASTTSRIENYLGFPSGVSGIEFGERAQLQAQRLGAHLFLSHAATSLTHVQGYFHVALDNEADLLAKAVIVATGISYRDLEVPEIERYEGLGVFHSPLDAEHIEARDPVVIVGGGNSAGQAAVAMASLGHHVFMVVRGGGLTATVSRYLVARIEDDPNVTVYAQSVVASVRGARRVESVVIEDTLTGERIDIRTHYLFVLIGGKARTAWLDGAVQLDHGGFILTGEEIPGAALSENGWPALGRRPYLLETSMPGVLAVGDVRANSVKRIAAAVGEGSMAVGFVQHFLGQEPSEMRMGFSPLMDKVR
jgi:thioredoxin reductase (NADPH)